MVFVNTLVKAKDVHILHQYVHLIDHIYIIKIEIKNAKLSIINGPDQPNVGSAE